jgi:hypothetical protein
MVSPSVELRESVRVLSLSPSEQLQYLRCIGLVNAHDFDYLDINVDELALQFEDAFIRIDAIDLPYEQELKVKELDQILKVRSSPIFQSFWTVRALFEDDDWEIIRRHARECFKKLNDRR